MNKKDRKPDSKGNVSRKGDVTEMTISSPFGVTHDVHIKPSDVQEMNISSPFGVRKHIEVDEQELANIDDRKAASPRRRTSSNKDISEDNMIQREILLQIMKEDILPVLRSEMGDIVEEKIRKVMKEAENHNFQETSCSRLQGEHDESSVSTQCWRHIRGGRPLSKADERECLANALQEHIREIVDGVVFKDSELPDNLLADGCLTEDECAGVRNKLDRKDQVRTLLSLIKGRDFDVMKRFLKHVRSHNENLAKRIDGMFEQNKKGGMRCHQCVYCKLTSQVNLKYIVDDLWRCRIIDDGLFNLIIETDRPAGAQRELWHEVLSSLNMTCEKQPSVVQDLLQQALGKKQHYNYLSKGATWMISNYGGLGCDCDRLNKLMSQNESLSLTSSSMSPRSSLSDFAENTQIDRIPVMMLNQKEFVADPVRRKGSVTSLRLPNDIMPEQHGIHRTTSMYDIKPTNQRSFPAKKSSLERHSMLPLSEF